jgi:CO/xanthine dehydrogenase FAD-binding subunit
VPIPALYRDDGIEYLAKRPDEVVTDLLLPAADGWRSAYLKLRRRGSFDFPVLGVAVAARMDGDLVREARIVLGAVASQPRPAEKAAAALVGERMTRELIARVADLAAGPAKPLDNTDFTHPYRKRVTRVFVARALAAIGGLGDGGPASEEVA